MSEAGRRFRDNRLLNATGRIPFEMRRLADRRSMVARRDGCGFTFNPNRNRCFVCRRVHYPFCLFRNKAKKMQGGAPPPHRLQANAEPEIEEVNEQGLTFREENPSLVHRPEIFGTVIGKDGEIEIEIGTPTPEEKSEDGEEEPRPHHIYADPECKSDWRGLIIREKDSSFLIRPEILKQAVADGQEVLGDVATPTSWETPPPPRFITSWNRRITDVGNDPFQSDTGSKDCGSDPIPQGGFGKEGDPPTEFAEISQAIPESE